MAAPERGLWRAVRWPLLVLAVALVGVGVAAVLDRTDSREWALTVGGPALTVLLPVGLVWLLVAVVVYLVRRQGASP
jgi:lipopolysaccharide export LptBFGC system permease protein LptF